MERDLYEIGNLKNDPAKLYDMALQFSTIFESYLPVDDAEIWSVLRRVNCTLWSNLPSVVVIDFRDPGDPETWGDFGSPVND